MGHHRTLDLLTNCLALRLLIKDLADIAKMSAPSFHRHFKEITAMSPIQFQKQLRLQEARRQLIFKEVDVAEVAFRVGYESLTQFTREYSRVFGYPPRKDMKRLKGHVEQPVDAEEAPEVPKQE